MWQKKTSNFCFCRNNFKNHPLHRHQKASLCGKGLNKHLHDAEMCVHLNHLSYFQSIGRDVNSSGSASGKTRIPVQDQQTALSLILELAVQRGTLSNVLSCVLLLLNLWNNSRHDYDNRVSSNLYSAPLIPLLKRFQSIQSTKSRVIEPPKWDEVCYFTRNTNDFKKMNLISWYFKSHLL